MAYAILFVPTASYLYLEGSLSKVQRQVLYIEQEISKDEKDNHFLAVFKERKEAERRFKKTFWKHLSKEYDFQASAYVEFEETNYYLTNHAHKVYFEIVEIK